MVCRATAAQRGTGLLLVALLAGIGGSAMKEKYSVHDRTRPHPPVVTPAEACGQPPSDAVVMFDGRDLSQWRSDRGNGPAPWQIVDHEVLVIVPGTGGIHTEQVFGNCQLHLEWRAPAGMGPAVTDQKRGNSGVFLMGRYEIQVLDSYTDDNYATNRTYADGQAAAVYGSYPPLANAMRPPGAWQSYDILLLKPLFDDRGRVVRKARVTVLHNGVCVHNNVELQGATAHRVKARYTPHGDGPLGLQDHGNPVAYRNIWVRPLPEEPYLY